MWGRRTRVISSLEEEVDLHRDGGAGRERGIPLAALSIQHPSRKGAEDALQRAERTP